MPAYFTQKAQSGSCKERKASIKTLPVGVLTDRNWEENVFE